MSDDVIEVWISASGTSAECSCGWAVSMPAGIIPQVVTDRAEAHETKTGHHWQTRVEAMESISYGIHNMPVED